MTTTFTERNNLLRGKILTPNFLVKREIIIEKIPLQIIFNIPSRTQYQTIFKDICLRGICVKMIIGSDQPII